MTITKEDVIQSISDGNLNPKMLQKFFNDIKLRSFSYDYRIQREMVSYFSTSFKFDPKKTEVREGVFTDKSDRIIKIDVDHKFLIAGEKEKYKRSDIFNEYLCEEEITKWNKFFLYYPIVFIDGVVFTNYRIKVHHDLVSFYFLVKDLHKISELTPGSTIDSIAKGGSIMFVPNSIGGVIDLEASDFHGMYLLTKKFPDTMKKFLNKFSSYMGFFVNKETGVSIMIPTMAYNPEGWFVLLDPPPTDISKYKLLAIGCNYFKTWNNIGNGDNIWLEFSSEKMPLPKDNLMVFVRNGISWIPCDDNEIKITEYYPNIYNIQNPNNRFIRLVALYEEEAHNTHIVYDEEIEPYLRRIDLLQRYKDGNVPEPLQEWKPVDWVYGIEDFIKKNPYADLNFNDRWDSFLYKMQSISDMLKKWFLLYEEYERRTFGFLSGWYHNIANYTNLADKIRYNTSPDLDDDSQYEEFSEPQYVFSYFNNTKYGIAKSYCYYIDGRYTIPTKVAITNRYQYVYLPKRLIKRDSIIEVERFDGIVYAKDFVLNGPVDIPFSSISKVPTVANSFFMVDVDSDTYIDDQVKMVVIDKVLGEVEVTPQFSVFIIEPTSIIRLIPSPEFEGKTVKLCCNNKIIQYSERESGLDYQIYGERYIDLNKNNAVCGINRALLPRLRLYTEDGRLIPKRDYTVLKHDKYNDHIQFHIPILVNDDMRIKVCYIGYDERIIYHKDNLDPRGLVSIHGRTSRPFSFKYHDVYLDGFRLTKYDIEMISPYTFIIKAIHKYGTNRVIEIYEKCHPDDKFVKFDYNEESEYIMDKLINTQRDFYDIIYESLEACTIDERLRFIDDYRDHWYDFFMYWVPYNFIEPNERRDLEAFFHLMSLPQGRVLLDPNERVKFSKLVKDVIFLDRNQTIKHGQDDPPIPDRELDICSVVPDKSIVVDEKEYREHGYIDDKFNPVYDEPYQPHEDSDEPTPIDPDAEEAKEYVHHTSFPHYDDTDRYESGPEEEEPIEFVDFNQDFYKMSEVYPGYFNSMETVPDKLEDPHLTNMSEMYQGCANLTKLLNLDTSNVTDMSYICDGCFNLTSLPNTFYPINVKNFDCAFMDCRRLNYLSPRFTFASMESARGAFQGCESLPSIFPVTIDCSNITHPDQLRDMFTGSSVSAVILSNVSADVRAGLTEDLMGVTSIIYN